MPECLMSPSSPTFLRVRVCHVPSTPLHLSLSRTLAGDHALHVSNSSIAVRGISVRACHMPSQHPVALCLSAGDHALHVSNSSIPVRGVAQMMHNLYLTEGSCRKLQAESCARHAYPICYHHHHARPLAHGRAATCSPNVLCTTLKLATIQ